MFYKMKGINFGLDNWMKLNISHKIKDKTYKRC